MKWYFSVVNIERVEFSRLFLKIISIFPKVSRFLLVQSNKIFNRFLLGIHLG